MRDAEGQQSKLMNGMVWVTKGNSQRVSED